jgi:hypothetical protein
MIVKNLVKSSLEKSPDEVISDTTMMFMACAAYVLHERNGFGKNRIAQFLADIEQVNRENEYTDIRKYLKETMGFEFPEVANEQL